MRPSRYTLLVALLTVSSPTHAVHVIFGGTQRVVRTRMDPIVNPGEISSHVHDVFGGSGFSQTYDYDKAINSQCTTVVIPQDKSNYWVPAAYYVNPNGTYSSMHTTMNIYYLVRGGPKNDVVSPFPKGLKMLAGDNNRGVYNASNPADQAVSYVCLDYNHDHKGDPAWDERPDFFDHQCIDGLRAQVFFPSCWDGVNLDSPDHKSHMSYPIGAYNDGTCPPSHPKHLISLFYEYILPVGDFPYHGPGSWSFANGDRGGLRFHGDFTNGWTDLNLLQQLISNCPDAAGNTADCPALAAVQNTDAAKACEFDGQVVDEDIGMYAPIAELPGCNQPWNGVGKGAQPTCGDTPTPGLRPAIQPLATGWSDLGCIAEGTSGRALTGSMFKSGNLTKASCSATCATSGFSYAGTEFGDECYCGNSLANGASQANIKSVTCHARCSGNEFETCGGEAALQLMHAAHPSVRA